MLINEKHGKICKTSPDFPKHFFANETELKMASRDDDESATWWLKPSVRSSKEKIFQAINQVEILCSWLEQEYWKMRNS
jgi:hypothetical protein